MYDGIESVTSKEFFVSLCMEARQHRVRLLYVKLSRLGVAKFYTNELNCFLTSQAGLQVQQISTVLLFIPCTYYSIYGRLRSHLMITANYYYLICKCTDVHSQGLF